MTTCPKCGTSVAENAADCPGCGVVLAKAADAVDRAYLRRQTVSRQRAVAPPPPEKKSPWRSVIILVVIAVCAFGAWQWYTGDTETDLDRLAAEVRQSDGSRELDDGRTSWRTWRLAAKFAIAIAIFAVGYLRLKQSMSP